MLALGLLVLSRAMRITALPESDIHNLRQVDHLDQARRLYSVTEKDPCVQTIDTVFRWVLGTASPSRGIGRIIEVYGAGLTTYVPSKFKLSDECVKAISIDCSSRAGRTRPAKMV